MFLEPHFDEGLSHAGFCCSFIIIEMDEEKPRHQPQRRREESHPHHNKSSTLHKNKISYFHISTRGLSEYLWTDCDCLSRCSWYLWLNTTVIQSYDIRVTKILQHVPSLLTGAWHPVHHRQTAAQPQRPQGWIAFHIWRMKSKMYENDLRCHSSL